MSEYRETTWAGDPAFLEATERDKDAARALREIAALRRELATLRAAARDVLPWIEADMPDVRVKEEALRAALGDEDTDDD